MSARLIKIGAGLGLSGLAVFLVLHFESRNDNPRPAARGKYQNQTVATDTRECSDIGNEILAKDGSAVDAAIAAMFCLGVINMHSSGIGGGGVMLVYNRSAKAASIIDFRETAPLIVSNFTPNATGVNESRFGGLAIAVPGEVKGMYQASQKYGRLPWKELVEPYYP